MRSRRNARVRVDEALFTCAFLFFSGCASAPKQTGPLRDALPNPPISDSCITNVRFTAPLTFGADDSFYASLLSASARGVIAVKYDCRGLRIVDDCYATGSYAFAATTLAETAVHVTRDNVHNFPFLTDTDILRLEKSVEILVVRTGLLSTTIYALHRDELRGDCKSATHFVQAIGLQNCADGTATQCIPVQIHVRPIADRRFPEAWAPVLSAGLSKCPRSMTWNGVLCEKGEADTSCETTGSTPCNSACELGIDSECERLSVADDGHVLQQACSAGVAAACAVVAQATGEPELFQRSCQLGDAASCARYTDLALLGETHLGGGYEAWRRACEGGVTELCWSWGLAAASGRAEFVGLYAYDAWVRGCQRGHGDSCFEAAAMRRARASGGEGHVEDVVDLLAASCAAPLVNWQGCLALGEDLLAQGGGERTSERALKVFERVCELKVRAGCVRAAAATLDRDRSRLLLGRACILGDVDACKQAVE